MSVSSEKSNAGAISPPVIPGLDTPHIHDNAMGKRNEESKDNKLDNLKDSSEGDLSINNKKVGSVFDIAHEMEHTLTELLHQIDEDEKDMNSKIDDISLKLKNLEQKLAK